MSRTNDPQNPNDPQKMDVRDQTKVTTEVSESGKYTAVKQTAPVYPSNTVERHTDRSENRSVSEGTGMHAGHGIAKQMGGSEKRDNLNLTDPTVNSVHQKRNEDLAVSEANKGNEVTFSRTAYARNEDPLTVNGKAVPSAFNDQAWVNGEKIKTTAQINPPSDKAREMGGQSAPTDGPSAKVYSFADGKRMDSPSPSQTSQEQPPSPPVTPTR